MGKIKTALFDVKDYDTQSFESICAGYDIELHYFDTKLTEETAALTEGFDAVCVFVNDDVTDKVIDLLAERGVRLLALRCAGYNNVDIEHAYGRIHVVRVPAYSPYAVAEHTMALLLTSIRRIHRAYNRTRDFNFSLNGLTGFDLYGKTVGVIGTGKIGRVFVNICKGFGMNVIAYDKFPMADSDIRYVELEEIWKQSDIISLHCPLTDENRYMINADTISKMKKGVMILNTSRGGLVDSEALLQGIKDRQVGGACLDVYEEESSIFFQDYSGHIVQDDTLARLISMPNVIVTSHQAFLTAEALGNIAQTTLENIRLFFTEDALPNEICYKCPEFDKCQGQHIRKCF